MYAPAIDERVGTHLITTTAFAALEGALYDEAEMAAGSDTQYQMRQRKSAELARTLALAPGYREAMKGTPYLQILPQETWAARAFHSAFALLCGLLAGQLVRPRGQPKSPSNPAAVMLK